MAWLSLAVFGLALLFLTGPDARADNAFPASTLSASTAVPSSDARDGDPRQDGQRDVSKAKKPRLGALRIRASRAMTAVATQGFHLQSTTRIPDARHPSQGIAAMPSTTVRRTDPALRLHPGQAPPRAA